MTHQENNQQVLYQNGKKKPYHCEANIYKCEEMKLENIKINTLFSKINLGLRVYITTMVSNRV